MPKKISVLCEQFFKMNNNSECLFGGGERFFYDFVVLLKKLGYETECYQFSTSSWTQRYKQLVVKGLGNITGNPQKDYVNGLNKFYQLSEKADGIFLLSMNLSTTTAKKPTLTVSHGLMFDYQLPGQENKASETLDMYKKWVRNSTHCLSVDSNSIKVMQVYDRRVASKMSYIPNYVSLEDFAYSEDWGKGDFTVLFPRRLDNCRGFTTMMSAVDILREKYPNQMKFVFCGRGNKNEEDYFNAWLKKNPINVEYMWKEMNQMPSVYKKATISCVPTVYAEGTSLSVLESLASGVPVITTIVGGLTDLIFDGVNGKLINPDYSRDFNNPDPTSLIEAIEYMYNNREHLAEMRENGLRMIRAFSKERWERDITKVIKKVYGEPL